MKRCVILLLSVCFLGWAPPCLVVAAPASAVTADYQQLPKPGKKVDLDAAHYFIFGFEKQPKLGNAIMRVDIFTRNGQRDSSFIVKGSADMPSMRGAHSSGDRMFALSKKGSYLMPVQLVMPGDWEFRFAFEKKGKTVFRGAYLFDL